MSTISPRLGHHRVVMVAASPEHAALVAAWRRAETDRVIADPRPDGCAYWIGAIGSGGYGLLRVDGEVLHAHRVAATVAHIRDHVTEPTGTHDACGDRTVLSPLRSDTTNTPQGPSSVYVRHRCDEPLCVRDSHLEVGDARANNLDTVQRGRHNGTRRSLTTDRRGRRGRSAAIRDALAAGWDADALDAAIADGDPLRDQMLLPFDPEN